MIRKRLWLLAPLLAFAACDSKLPEAPIPPGDGDAHPEAVHEQTLAANIGLRVGLNTTVALDLEAPGATDDGDTGESGLDVVPYHVDIDEDVTFCLDDLGQAVSSVVLVDKAGHTVLDLKAGADCGTARLTRGNYEAHVRRAPTSDPQVVPLFFHQALGSAATPQCTPEESTPDLDTGGPTDLWYFVDGSKAIYGRPRVRYDSVRDMISTLKFSPESALRVSRGVGDAFRIATSDDQAIVAARSNADGTSALDVGPGSTEWRFTPVPDGAKWTFTITGAASPNPIWSGRKDSSDALLGVVPSSSGWPAGVVPLRVTAAMRYVENGSTLRTLKRGEVALYEGCNFSGRAWVFNDSNAFPSVNRIDGFADRPKSLRVGCDTTLIAETMTGSRQIVSERFGGDVACNLLSVYNSPLVRITVASTRKITIETNKCTNCNLRNVDMHGVTFNKVAFSGGSLEGANFDGSGLDDATFTSVNMQRATFRGASLKKATFTGASASAKLDMGGATLDDAKLNEAILNNVSLALGTANGAVFDGATLNAVSFHRTTLDRATFIGTKFRDIEFTETDLRQTLLDAVPKFELPPGQALIANPCDVPLQTGLTLSRMARTKVRLTQLPIETWRLLDLTDTKFTFEDIPVAERRLQNKVLCGLRLQGVEFFRFDMRQSRFNRSDLKRIYLAGADLRFATFNGAVLDGASFSNSDLTEAVFDDVTSDGSSSDASAKFERTLFAPASLLRAHFTKGIFSEAVMKLPFPPTKHLGATFDGANFNRADFTGSDLTGLSMTGADFDGAILSETRLSNTAMGAGSRASTFNGAVFCKASVLDANFNGAVLTNALFPRVAGITLPNANKSQPPVACDPILAPGGLDVAVKSRGATCPRGNPVAADQSCVGSDWDVAVIPPRAVCPARTFSSPPAVMACGECSENCDCVSYNCIEGICASCTP